MAIKQKCLGAMARTMHVLCGRILAIKDECFPVCGQTFLLFCFCESCEVVCVRGGRSLNFGRDKAIVDCGSSSVSIGIGIGTGTGIGTGICHLSIRSSKQQTIVGAYYFAVLEALR